MGCGSSHIMPNTNYDVIVLPIYRRNMKEPSCLHFVCILDNTNPILEEHMIGIYHTETNTIEIELNKKKCIYTQGRNHKDIWVYAFTK